MSLQLTNQEDENTGADAGQGVGTDLKVCPYISLATLKGCPTSGFGGFSGETHTSLRLTKDDENNPLLPVAMLRSNGNPAPLEKGGKGGFEGFSGESYSSERSSYRD